MTAKPYKFNTSDATREQIILRAAFMGPSNSGKSWTAMLTASRLAERLNLGPVYVIDSENRAALRYAKSPNTGHGFAFKHVEMPFDDFSPEAYCAAIDHCEAEGARVILIDGISQEWTDAPRSVLEQVDEITEESKSKNAFGTGWREMTPRHNAFVQRILRCSAHLIATMRVKTAYEMVKNERSGKMEPKKIGLAPVQRPGVEYEFDLLFTMADAVLTVGKTRCDRIAPQTMIERPGPEFADLLADWIEDVDQTPAKVAPGLAKFVTDLAAENAPEARAKLLAQMRQKREPLPVQTAALKLFDETVRGRAA